MNMKNWKTTLMGCIMGVVSYTITIAQSGNPWDWKAWVIGAVAVKARQ